AGPAPRPRVAEPERRQKLERRRLGSAVLDGDAEEEMVRRLLRRLERDVEVGISVENAGIDELELGLVTPAPRVFLDEPRVRKGTLRVAIEAPQVRARRCRVEVVVDLLHVLAVIALVAGEPEEPLLQDRVAAVPQRQREAEAPLAVADPEEA